MPSSFDNLWFGDPMGKTLYLTESWTPEHGADATLERGRRTAEGRNTG